jgi:KDO2-lipid IV(A) lauroyltransferase
MTMNRYLLAFEVCINLLQRLGLQRAIPIGRGLGRLMFLSLPQRRRWASQAIEQRLGTTRKRAVQLAKSSFLHAGQSFMEHLFTREFDYRFMHDHVEVASPKSFYPWVETNRPIVGVTGHFGAWELLAGVLNLHFQSRPAQIVVRQPKNETMSRIMTRFRQGSRIEVVHRDQAASKVLSNLRKNGITAFLVDQNTGRSKAVFLPFLGRYAAVNMGPALLAIRAKALVWPIFLLRNGNQQYTLEAHPPLDTLNLKAASLEDKITEVATFYTQAVEQMVLRYPEQWFWMHRRWKKRPKWEDATAKKSCRSCKGDSAMRR